MNCTPSSLAAASICFACDSISEKQLLAMQVYLLCQLANGGGSGGGAAILSGSGSPEGVVTSTASPQFYVDTSGQALWIFEGTIGANTGWVNFI